VGQIGIAGADRDPKLARLLHYANFYFLISGL
jgi:hypothetical protein